MDENRAETLRILIDLASGDDAVSCFDGARAARLLKSQSTRKELEELGFDPVILDQIWDDDDE